MFYDLDDVFDLMDECSYSDVICVDGGDGGIDVVEVPNVL